MCVWQVTFVTVVHLLQHLLYLMNHLRRWKERNLLRELLWQPNQLGKLSPPSTRHYRSISSKCDRMTLDQKVDRTKQDTSPSKPESLQLSSSNPESPPYGSSKSELFEQDAVFEHTPESSVSAGDVARPSSASKVHLPSGKKQAAVKAVPRSDLPPLLSQPDARGQGTF